MDDEPIELAAYAIMVTRIQDGKVRIGIEAPKHVKILHTELVVNNEDVGN